MSGVRLGAFDWKTGGGGRGVSSGRSRKRVPRHRNVFFWRVGVHWQGRLQVFALGT